MLFSANLPSRGALEVTDNQNTWHGYRYAHSACFSDLRPDFAKEPWREVCEEKGVWALESVDKLDIARCKGHGC
jgi:hypothetical protein